MQTYTVNEKKRRKALKQLTQDKRKTLKGFPKVCFYIAMGLKLIGLVCGTANVLHMVFWSHKWHEMILLQITFIAPYGLSFIPQTVYVVTLNREYSFRRRESITFKPYGFIYSYHDDRTSEYDSIFAYDIQYSQIKKIERNERTRLLTVSGDFVTNTYSGDKITETLSCRVFDFLDVYDVDMKQMLEKQLLQNGMTDIII